MLQPLFESAAWLRSSRASRDFATEGAAPGTGDDELDSNALPRASAELEGRVRTRERISEANGAYDPNSEPADEPPVYMALAPSLRTRTAGAAIDVLAPPTVPRRRQTLTL